MKVKSEREVAQIAKSLRDPMDCSLPGSPIHGIFHARVLEWGAIVCSDIYNYVVLLMVFAYFFVVGLIPFPVALQEFFLY